MVPAPAQHFNAPGQERAHVCVSLSRSRPPLRFANGAPDGFRVTDRAAVRKRRCPPGRALLDLHEFIPSSAGPLVFRLRDYSGKAGGKAKYGELAASDIARPLPPAVPAGGGRGAPCTLANELPYRVSVRSIPKRMHYKRPEDLASDSNHGASFMHYGDPAADQGNDRAIHYSYLLWSFVNVRGGGMVRTLLAPHQVLQACDVNPITMPSWGYSGRVNGSVTARYVRTLAGTCPIYGWMVWSHTYPARSPRPVPHALPMLPSSTPDPRPDAACPASAPAGS